MRIGTLVVCLAVLTPGCGGQSNNSLTQLASVEVREYKGEHLGSILDFRENSIKGPQHIDVSNYRLQISGLVSEPMAYTYEQVLAFPHYSKVVTLHCVEGWSVKILWQGVLIKDILRDAGTERGANTVIFRSYDGYSTSLPLDYVLANDIMLAYKMNNVVLPPERGYPFEVVAESKLGYKWAKWVTDIELSDDPSFRGFWESLGYDNDAEVH